MGRLREGTVVYDLGGGVLMVACENTSCPWWDEGGCLFCEEWEEGEYMNRPEEEEEDDRQG